MTNPEPPTCWAVVPAGGSGSRFSGREDKLLTRLNGVPVLVRSVSCLFESPYIAGLVIAARPHAMAAYQRVVGEAGLTKPVQWVVGGETRRASVYQGLKALPAEAELVAIHDAARPMVEVSGIDSAIEAVLKGASASLLALPVQDTLKEKHSETGTLRTLNRANIWRAQTPQVFPVSRILEAHEAISQETVVTDDIQLLELHGVEMGSAPRAELIEGRPGNIKITTEDDVQLAEYLLSQAQTCASM